jgi:hypothetical protein
MIDLTQLTAAELLRCHADIGTELRRREIVRSENITGDMAEYLFCRAFGWTPATNSKAHFDAVDKDGIHYQIKGRRLTPANQSRELGAIRDIAGRHFNFLAGLLFDRSCDVILRAAIIPQAVVMKHARPALRSNSHKFLLRDDIWDVPGVCDVTDKLTAAAHTLDQL